MNRNRFSLLLAVLSAVVVAAAGFFLGVQPQLASAAANTAQRDQIDTTNAANRAELERLRAKFEKLPEMRAELDSLRDSVPATPRTPEFITSLDAIAGTTGVTVSSVTIGEAQAYTSPAEAASASGAASATATAPESTPSPSASATASAAPEPTAPSAVTDPLVTASNFAVIPVSVGVDGTYDQALAFTKGVQDGKRLFLINGLTSTVSDSGDGGSKETWTLSGYVYVLQTGRQAASATDG